MSRIRLHLPPERWGARVRLEPPEHRHLIDVLRQTVGDRVEVFDGDGGVCQAVLERDVDGWCLVLGARTEREETGETWLGCALLKGRKLDEVIRMVTEIGVSGFVPFVSARSISRPDAKRAADRLERWQTIATQAARQAGRARVPRVDRVQMFDDVLRQPPPGTGILLHEKAGPSMIDLIDGLGPQARFVLVGPEGGFSQAEVDRAAQAGIRVAGLGLPVLRAPTAAVVAAAFACVSKGCSLDFHKAVE